MDKDIGSLRYSSKRIYDCQKWNKMLLSNLSSAAKKIKRKDTNIKKEDYEEFVINRKKHLAESKKNISEQEAYLLQARKELFNNILTNTIPAEKVNVIDSFLSEYRTTKNDNKELTAEQFFATIDIDNIPADKTPTLVSLLADYLNPSYKQTMFANIKPYSEDMYFVKSTNMNTPILDLPFSVRICHVLNIAKIRTLGDLVVAYKKNPKHFLSYPNFAKQSNKDLKKFLEGNRLV